MSGLSRVADCCCRVVGSALAGGLRDGAGGRERPDCRCRGNRVRAQPRRVRPRRSRRRRLPIRRHRWSTPRGCIRSTTSPIAPACLTAVITDGHGGRGTLSLNYLGDSMQGEASRVEPNYRGSAASTAMCSVCPPCSCRGRAASPTRSGREPSARNAVRARAGRRRALGACVFSDGARYQLHFG